MGLRRLTTSSLLPKFRDHLRSGRRFGLYITHLAYPDIGLHRHRYYCCNSKHYILPSYRLTSLLVTCQWAVRGKSRDTTQEDENQDYLEVRRGYHKEVSRRQIREGAEIEAPTAKVALLETEARVSFIKWPSQRYHHIVQYREPGARSKAMSLVAYPTKSPIELSIWLN